MNSQVRDNFRHCMRRLAATVCVITCQHQGVRYGITATAVTSLCVEPVSILVCINGASSLLAPLLAEKRYAINLLSQQHSEISQRFSSPQAAHERFSSADWLSNEHGVPYLNDAQATLFCQLDQTVPYATHHIVIGQVSDCHFREDVAPLIYQNGVYASAIPLPDVVAS